MLTRTPDLIRKLNKCHLLLDTNVFFHAVNNEDFYNLLLELHNSECALLTIQPVVFEFARGAKRSSNLTGM